MKKSLIYLIISSLSLLLISACGESKPEINKIELQTKAKQVFSKLPATMPGTEADTQAKIELGKKLYFEKALSKTNTQSCNSCHMIDAGKAGVDNLRTSPGAKTGTIGTRNSPTVLNAGFQFAQFWDGRAKDLKEQALGPILNPLEMGMDNPKEVENKLAALPEYKAMFAAAFPNNPIISWDNLGEAVASFERTLITKDRFDFFLGGNPNALTDEEAEGLQIFIGKGCTTCHTGQLLGGNMYQKMGLYKPYEDTLDLGRYAITKNEAEKFFFKVPTLRNVSLTNPYFHDGLAATLEEAVTKMSNMQLTTQLTLEEVKKVVIFLGSLSDIEIVKANKTK